MHADIQRFVFQHMPATFTRIFYILCDWGSRCRVYRGQDYFKSISIKGLITVPHVLQIYSVNVLTNSQFTICDWAVMFVSAMLDTQIALIMCADYHLAA